MLKHVKVEIPFYYEAELNKTKFEGIAIYFLENLDDNLNLIFESVKITKVIFKTRITKIPSGLSECIKYLMKQESDLKLRFNVLNENEFSNNSNNIKQVSLNEDDQRLINFNNAYKKSKYTINSIYKYMYGVNTSGQNTVKNSKFKILEGEFKDCQFIQFFTYILGNIKTINRSINENYFDNTINFDYFFDNYLVESYKDIFRIINDLPLKSAIFNNKQIEEIKNSSWESIVNNFLIAFINSSQNQRINNTSQIENNLKNYILPMQRNLFRNRIINSFNNNTRDDIYKTFIALNPYVEYAHIYEVKNIKEEYIFILNDNSNVSEKEKANILNQISDVNNCLLLPSHIHTMWDQKYIQLKQIGDTLNARFENINLNQEEWDFLKINELTLTLNKEQIYYLNLRNSVNIN